MLLYEQGVLDMNADDSKYQSLASGSMGAYEFMSYVISNKIITVGQLALKPCSGSAVVTNPDNGDVRDDILIQFFDIPYVRSCERLVESPYIQS